MKTTKIYISGKITGRPYDEAKKVFDEAEEYLLSFKENLSGNIEVINPMKAVPQNNAMRWIDYMVKDIELLATCDAIYMLKGWEHSQGARIEHALAVGAGINTIYSND